MKVYAAFRSYPDYHAGPPSLHSLHETLEGAIESLYPDKEYAFRQWPGKDIWEGPDGFGLIKLMEVNH